MWNQDYQHEVLRKSIITRPKEWT